ncbi:MAG TPA: EamA family transporter [Bacteroidales bacterium]|nr:EamA family transporter [Bacteroidales bacterium]
MGMKIGAKEWAALVFLMLVWGSSFILVKRGLESFSGMELGALRIVITFAILLPFAITRIRKVPMASLKFFAITGLIGSGIPPFLFGIAQMHIDSFLAGVLNALTPLFTLVIGVAFFRAKASILNVVGVLLALAGAAGLLMSVHNPQLGNGILYGLLVVVATVMYALNMNIIKKHLASFDPLTITSLMFASIGIPATIYLFAQSGFVATMQSNPQAWISFGYVAILAIFGSAISMVVHNWLIHRTSALFASTVTYMMPIVSIAWGIADGELFLLGYFLWIALILLGVYLTNKVR